MTYAILQVAAAAYDDIRARIVAIDEKIGLTEYQRTYIRPAEAATRRPEHIVFGPVGLERLPDAPIPKDVGELPHLHHVTTGIGVIRAGAVRRGEGREVRVLAVIDATKIGMGALVFPVAGDGAPILRAANLRAGCGWQIVPPHVDDMNDAVLVGLALEDDARALADALYDDGVLPFGTPNDLYSVEVSGNIINLVALARVMRARYIPHLNDRGETTPPAAHERG